MVLSPISMYIVIWVFVSSLLIVLLYEIVRFSRSKTTRRAHEPWVVRPSVRSFLDRRSGVDRRKAHNLDYFLSGGIERRSWKERRSRPERRVEWVRVDEWVSVLASDLEREFSGIRRDI